MGFERNVKYKFSNHQNSFMSKVIVKYHGPLREMLSKEEEIINANTVSDALDKLKSNFESSEKV